MIAGHALRVSDPGQTLAFDHAMAPVLALCGVVQNGTVLMLESALPIGPSFLTAAQARAARAALGIKAASTRRNER